MSTLIGMASPEEVRRNVQAAFQPPDRMLRCKNYLVALAFENLAESLFRERETVVRR